MIKAIPTKYAGRQYRSILEAKWAAFFDLVRVKVEYEPEAFNGYIPDFIWTHTDNRYRDRFFHVFREGGDDEGPYGPGNSSVVFEVKGRLEEFDHEKIWRSGWHGAVLCLDGRGPLHVSSPNNEVLETDEGGGQCDTAFDFLTNWVLDWRYTEKQLEAFWVQAANLVQWKAPK